jgi:hypothetical protein
VRQNPGLDQDAMAYVIRTHLPLVQVPAARSAWGYPGVPEYVEAHVWLKEQVATGREEEGADASALVRAYLRAFGPASVADAQRWSGRAGLAATFEAMGDELIRYQGPEAKTVLYDLAGSTISDEDMPAPVRLIPEYDNLVLGHEDRSRIIDEAFKKRVFLSAARVCATVLVDGFVAGVWRLSPLRDEQRIIVTPFVTLDRAARDGIEAEAARLSALWPDVQHVSVEYE